MKVIAELVSFVKDEAKSVKKYGKMAIRLKAENKELADMFYNMANTESGHLDSIHNWLVKYIDKEKKERKENIPQGMLDVWQYEHKEMVDCLIEAKIVLQNYQKM